MYTFGLFSILSIVVAIAYLMIALIGFVREPRRLPNILFALAGIALACWGIGEGMQRAAVTPELAYFWAAYVVTIAAAIHPAALLHFWLVFTRESEKIPRFVIGLLYVPAIVLVPNMLVHPEWFVVGVQREYWGYVTVMTDLYVLAATYVVLYVIAVTALAFKTAWYSTGDMRRNSLYIALSISLTLVLGTGTQLIAPLFGIRMPELTIASTLAFVLTVGYAMSRRHLLAIDSTVIVQNIINTIDDVVLATSTDMKIEFVNGAVQRRFGYDPSELVNRSLSSIFSDELLAAPLTTMQSWLPIREHQTSITTKSGTKRTVVVTATLLKTGHTMLGVTFVIRDITELNQAIEELKVKRVELERSQIELKEKVEELEKMNKFFVDRELRISELKRKIDELEGRPASS